MTAAGNADAAADMGKWTARHYKTYEEAREAACEIRRNSPLELVVRVNKSPYGGFRLSVLPVDVYADLLVDGILPRGMRRRCWSDAYGVSVNDSGILGRSG